MATIRKRFGKWQVQIRRHNYPQIIKSFKEKSTASKYAREIELKMDKQQFEDYSNAAGTTLRDILTRYRDEITPKKKGAKWETYKLNLLIRHKISSLSLLHLNPTALYALKNELSINRKPGTVKHYFSFINNAWNTAERVWGINLPPKNPIKYVILDKVYDRRDRILNEEEYKIRFTEIENAYSTFHRLFDIHVFNRHLSIYILSNYYFLISLIFYLFYLCIFKNISFLICYFSSILF
jgi:hypothetical protein